MGMVAQLVNLGVEPILFERNLGGQKADVFQDFEFKFLLNRRVTFRV